MVASYWFAPSTCLILMGLLGVLNFLPLKRASYYHLRRSSEASYNFRLGTVL